MCRPVIAVFLYAFISCAQSDPGSGLRKVNCSSDPLIIKSKTQMQQSFANVVKSYLEPSSGAQKNTSEFDEKFSFHYENLNRQCKLHIVITNKAFLMELIEYSLKNQSFKEFYDDINCVIKMEKNMSNCVRSQLGFFNVSKEQLPHWYRRQNLLYDARSCGYVKNTEACMEVVLNSCKTTTRRYVASLFDFALRNCTSAVMNASSTNATIIPDSVPVTSQTAIISASVVVVVSVIGIGLIIFIKYR